MELKFLTKIDLPDNAFTVSRSRIGTWHSCQYRHELTYNRGLERHNFSTGPMALGTAIHRHFDVFYKNWLNGPVGYIEDRELMALCYDIYREAQPYDSRIYNLRAATLLQRYKDYAATNDMFIPLATEYELYANLEMKTPDGRPIYLHGIIDLLYEIDDILGFMDHKSGGKFWDDRNAYFDNQLAFYYLLFVLNGLPFEVACINNVNTYPYKSLSKVPDEKLFKRIYVTRNHMKTDHYLKNLKNTIRQLLNIQYPTQNLDKHCSFCPFHDVCDLELRGLNSERLIQVYKKDDVEFNTDILVEETYD